MHIRRHRNFIKEGQKFWGGVRVNWKYRYYFLAKTLCGNWKKLEYWSNIRMSSRKVNWYMFLDWAETQWRRYIIKSYYYIEMLIYWLRFASCFFDGQAKHGNQTILHRKNKVKKLCSKAFDSIYKIWKTLVINSTR